MGHLSLGDIPTGLERAVKGRTVHTCPLAQVCSSQAKSKLRQVQALETTLPATCSAALLVSENSLRRRPRYFKSGRRGDTDLSRGELSDASLIESGLVVSLVLEPHSGNIGANRGASFTHPILVASPAGVARRIRIGTIVRCGRD